MADTVSQLLQLEAKHFADEIHVGKICKTKGQIKCILKGKMEAFHSQFP